MNKNAPKKKARVFDFDDTLAKSKSNVLYLLPDGTTGSLTATEFAEQSGELAELGAQFDFSEFSTVKDGSKGPLAVLAKKLTEAKGDRDIFVLTARPAAAAESIKSFLRSALGISVPLDNITGLGDGTAGAKAYWMAEKVSEGYNDLFFADDAPKNVAAVDKMLTDLGVKKKVQLAKEAEAKSIEDEMDTILRSKKPTKGSVLKKLNIYVPPGADDFAGLLYTFLGKGAVGDAQMKFFQDNIMTPFAQGINAYETAKVTLARDYKALKKR
jgi:phosphoglycolate phosphatase-like HAD superfamily hydrolase